MKRTSSFTVSRRGVLAASTVGALGAALVAVPLLAVSASATQSDDEGKHKVTICHRNNDAKKPYVEESVDIASTGLLKSGHNDHKGDLFAPGMKDDHDKWGDVIPAYTYKISEHKTFSFPGLNWDAEGKALLAAHCKIVVVTPSESTPAEEPTDEPSASESTATEEPSQEPTATETTATEEPSQEPTATESSATEEAGPGPSETTPTEEPTATETPATEEPSQEPTPSESTATEEPSQDPTPETSSPSDPSVPTETSSEDPGLPSTGGNEGSSNGATLPKTGSDSTALLAMAAGLVTVGAASIVIARRRTEAETD